MRKILFLLGELSDADVEWLIENGSRQDLRAGEMLIEGGRATSMMYIVLDGALEVAGVQLGDKPILLHSGEVVGEISLLDSRPPTTSVIASTDAIVFAIPQDDLRAKLSEDIEFGARFYRALAVFLAHRMRNTYQRLGYGKDTPLDEDEQYDDEL
ncbi:MAG: cyclic nucleotide-binding domain-containing protein, partial [Planctomycetales bacterium]|nr:cyclic nucleotide-binding domain-containing protein [Planctomycetales bacterium]